MPIPQDLGYVDRTKPEHILDLEVAFLVGKKELGKIIEKSIKVHGTSVTADVLDKIKSQGYKYSTKGAITISVSDAVIPPQKKQLIAEAEEKIDGITKMYRRGLLSNDERYEHVIKTWD
jgi:DNA-directed RNA polymerase subunit beta'